MEELDRLRSLYQAIKAIESNRGELPSDLSYPSREDEQELFRRVTDIFRRFKGLARIVSGEPLAHHSQTDDATEVARDTATGFRGPQRHEQLDVRYLEEVCALLKERRKLARSILDERPSGSEEGEVLLESLENLKRGILRRRSYLITSNRGLVFSSVASMCKSEKAKRIRDDLESTLTRLRDGLCLLDFSTLRQTERAKVLLSRVLGLDGQEADSIADVAASLKISRSAAADILRVALSQLGIDRQSLPISRVSKFS